MAYGAALVPERYQGLRLGWCDVWCRGSELGNPYAHHVTGLHPVVDLNTMSLLELEDSYQGGDPPNVMGEYLPRLIPTPLREVTPLQISQPAGVGFTLEGRFLTWQDWQLRIGFNHREGLVLHQVAFRDGERWRSVAHRLSFAEMVVPYRDASPDHYRRTAFDIGEWGLGFMRPDLLLDEAIAYFRRAIAIKNDVGDVYTNLGGALQQKGEYDEALSAYRRAVDLSPMMRSFIGIMRLLLLGMGDFARGWEEFEWRLANAKMKLNRDFVQPQWDGSAAKGKRILVHGEGGLGDTLQFVRLLPRVRESGATVILECQAGLAPLLEGMEGMERVVTAGQVLPAFDLQIPLPGLPRIFRITVENIPGTVPYLRVPQERRNKWAGQIVGDGLLKVGLVWAGATRVSGNRGARHCRSLRRWEESPGCDFSVCRWARKRGSSSRRAWRSWICPESCGILRIRRQWWSSWIW